MSALDSDITSNDIFAGNGRYKKDKKQKGKCIHNEATLFLSGNFKIAIKKERKKKERECVCFREIERETDGWTDRQMDRHMGGWMDRQMNVQIDSIKSRQTI